MSEDDKVIRAKWSIDGARTLAHAAALAHEFGNYLQSLHDQGYVLRGDVEDDYGFYYKPEPHPAAGRPLRADATDPNPEEENGGTADE